MPVHVWQRSAAVRGPRGSDPGCRRSDLALRESARPRRRAHELAPAGTSLAADTRTARVREIATFGRDALKAPFCTEVCMVASGRKQQSERTKSAAGTCQRGRKAPRRHRSEAQVTMMSSRGSFRAQCQSQRVCPSAIGIYNRYHGVASRAGPPGRGSTAAWRPGQPRAALVRPWARGQAGWQRGRGSGQPRKHKTARTPRALLRRRRRRPCGERPLPPLPRLHARSHL